MTTLRIPRATRCEVVAEEYRHFVGKCGFTYHEFCDQMARVYHLSPLTVIDYLTDAKIYSPQGLHAKGRQERQAAG